MYCSRQMNRVNCRNDFGHDESTINIGICIVIIIITGVFQLPCAFQLGPVRENRSLYMMSSIISLILHITTVYAQLR